MQTWDGTTPLPPRSTPKQIPLTVTTRFGHTSDISGYWTAEVRLITHQDDQGTSGYTLWTHTEPHDPANGSADLTEQVTERAIGQFANRLAELLAGPPARTLPDG